MKDRRKNSIRKRETRRNRFIGFRAREIVSEPMTYQGQDFYEVHVVANLGGYVLTLFPKDRKIKKLGLRVYWDQYKRTCERSVVQAVENLIDTAKAGELTGLEEQVFSGCMF